MGYPDTFEGFMIEDQSKWTEFKKQEVKYQHLLMRVKSVNLHYSSSQRNLKIETLISRSKHAVSAALMSTP